MNPHRIDPFIFTQYHSFLTFKWFICMIKKHIPKVHQASENKVILSKSRKSSGETVQLSGQAAQMSITSSSAAKWSSEATFSSLELGIRLSRCFSWVRQVPVALTVTVVLPFWELAVADTFVTGSGHQSLRKVEGKGSWICKYSWVFSHCWSWSSRLLLSWIQLAKSSWGGLCTSAPSGWESSPFCTLQSFSLCNALK